MEADGAPSTGPNVENPAEAELLKRFFATIKAVPEERRASVYRVAIAAAERSALGEDVEADASRPHSRDPVFMALARGVVRKRDEASASAAKRPKKPKGPTDADAKRPKKPKGPKAPLPGRRGGGQALPLFLGPRTVESARAAMIGYVDGVYGASRGGARCPPDRYAGWSVVITGSAVEPLRFVDGDGRVWRTRNDAARKMGLVPEMRPPETRKMDQQWAKTHFGDRRALLLEGSAPAAAKDAAAPPPAAAAPDRAPRASPPAARASPPPPPPPRPLGTPKTTPTLAPGAAPAPPRAVALPPPAAAAVAAVHRALAPTALPARLAQPIGAPPPPRAAAPREAAPPPAAPEAADEPAAPPAAPEAAPPAADEPAAPPAAPEAAPEAADEPAAAPSPPRPPPAAARIPPVRQSYAPVASRPSLNVTFRANRPPPARPAGPASKRPAPLDALQALRNPSPRAGHPDGGEPRA
ncbi:hypothetical protein AURANDRAFT_64293 [Aureococcus anophagefferens]|uniref:Uncharacterized protein n=1 Tax=Aureococcus anophagefferens TaxID=44056 RepID=F0Y9N5_AURAN|nr:hypothetical protein AURANDRAFT_64293 [Aureococcus anophagefferens]EGB08270.1 hypothetical protein AURANDRAFT_64293 [Aureococcus anophagefferens]|eukprot:XP_009036999.1 hypothetical protein AURANDRAFT_64293 [Aureococcus anophagefferens]